MAKNETFVGLHKQNGKFYCGQADFGAVDRFNNSVDFTGISDEDAAIQATFDVLVAGRLQTMIDNMAPKTYYAVQNGDTVIESKRGFRGAMETAILNFADNLQKEKESRLRAAVSKAKAR